MRLLLDTHVALWLAVSPSRLSASTSTLLRDARQELLLSAASAWEISIKHASGKVALPSTPEKFLPEMQRRLNLVVVPIRIEHAIRAGGLPPLHADPFDRMLVAQAQTMGTPVVTVDPKLAQYEVEVIPG